MEEFNIRIKHNMFIKTYKIKNSTMTKKLKIRGLEKALKNIPIEERFKIGNEIRKLFENFDPKNPPGSLVIPVPVGTIVCPKCNEKLIVVDKNVEISGNRKVNFLDCIKCDETFEEPVTN